MLEKGTSLAMTKQSYYYGKKPKHKTKLELINNPHFFLKITKDTALNVQAVVRKCTP